MASSGLIKTTTAFGYVELTWTTTSQSIENNTSTISYSLNIYRDKGGIVSTASKNYSIKINGITVASGTNTIGGEGLKTLKTGTTTIPHNADGTKTFSLSFSQEIAITWNGSYIDTIAGSGSGTLNTIARATTPTFYASSVELGGTATIYLNRASTSFSHYLEYKIGNLTGSVGSGDTAFYWAIPLNLAQAMPNSKSGVITILCHTYMGSTYIGTKSNTFTITIPSTMKPTATIGISEAVDGIKSKFNAYVQNKSKLNVSINASGIYGSTITSYKTTILGINYASASFTSNLLSKSGETQILTLITDSRGMTNEYITTINVLEYQAPTLLEFKCERTDANGNLADEGKHLKAYINFSISSLNNLNNKNYKLEYKRVDETTWKTATSGSVYSYNSQFVSSGELLNIDYSYDIRLTLTDYFTSLEAYSEIGTGYTLLDFNKSGKGMAIGKASEKENELEIALPTSFTSKPSIENGAKLLWSGRDQMGSGVSKTLSENVSKQNYGIVLVFTRETDYNITSFFIPKNLVSAHNGAMHSFFMTTEFIYMSHKYIYIYDNKVEGHTSNTQDKGQDSKTGFIYNNSVYYLRYIYGI